MHNIKKVICCVMLFLVTCLFTGCHTVHGAGEDIEQGGKAIERAADKHM